MSRFYGWCVDNEHCMNVPFTYSWARHLTETGGQHLVQRNSATLRRAKPHVTMKYLGEEFAEHEGDPVRRLTTSYRRVVPEVPRRPAARSR
ncbi:hypothetical protein ACH4FX_36030 [Streptomyces sp. NPDC018019]|uniref:hypothetical protein n=1 Tax=Streptomyces sp. NPDC018019 TaxID=3365030 RepID=UPI0037AC9E29